ncbi:MAG: SUF system NifU family Fe-S cluster assembly protein [Gemmatimonadaceae bacterium]|nr:SUF system NifU family Fe-S cluster assembly protein [Gemmatimonadaceae bacterium]
MSDLEALYQSIILDHNRRPKNFGELPAPVQHAAGKNPLCGDEVAVYVKLDGDRLSEVSFTGKGCAISRASASLMTGAVKGKTRAEADALFDLFHDVVTGKVKAEDHKAELGSLIALGGVAKFPVRVKCASMAWHTLKKALESPTS